jgi:hypothetical protein
MFGFRNEFTHSSRNLRWPVDSDWLNTSFIVDTGSVPIRFVPFKLVDCVLECLTDGLKEKLKEFDFLSSSK